MDQVLDSNRCPAEFSLDETDLDVCTTVHKINDEDSLKSKRPSSHNSTGDKCTDFHAIASLKSNSQTKGAQIEGEIPERSQHEMNSAREMQRYEQSLKVSETFTEEKPATCAKLKTSLNTCQICCHTAAKYRCPRCEIKTCSLPCVKQHKVTSGCTGERDKTAFVDISCYSDKDLLNDYRFLEDAERRLFSNLPAPFSHGRQSARFAPYHLSKRCKFLMNAAYKRGISLSFVHPGLSRNKTNTSFYTISADAIEWHVDWLFSSSNTLVKDERVAETQVLIDAVRKFTNFTEYPHLRKSLEMYRGDKLDSCQFLLKVEGLPANRIRYFPLKPTETLAENLKGLCLIEYPTIVVVSSSDQHAQENYSHLCREDMVEMDRGSARHMVKFHPQLIPSNDVEKEILNINSSLYLGSQEKRNER